ncbi:hypothetical protein F2Q69_00051945, partial [Brassica cretica]
STAQSWCDSNRPSNRPVSRLAVWYDRPKPRDVSLGLNHHNLSCSTRLNRKRSDKKQAREAGWDLGTDRAAVRSYGPSVRSDGATAHQIPSEPPLGSPRSSPCLGLPS